MKKFQYVFSCNASGRPYARASESIEQRTENVAAEWRTTDNACVVLDETQVLFASETERFSKKKHDFAKPKEPFKAFASRFCFDNAQLEDFNVFAAPKNHHENHIYEVFYQSGFSEAAVLVNDGEGSHEDCVTFSYMREREKPFILKKFSSENSPCNLYGLASARLFMRSFAHGKFMGLASYGKDDGNSYISFDNATKTIKTNMPLVEEKLSLLFPNGIDRYSDVMQAKDLAYTVQKNFEDTLVSIVLYFKELLGQENIQTGNLCMSGGGILNCPTNSRIVDLGLFKHYYASPQPCDGCAESIGKAFRNMEALGKKLHSRRLSSAYLGLSYTSADITENDYVHLKNPSQKICEHLEKGGVIAWYQGGAEYGPRALGHRSFLADPSKKEMLEALNKIKGREQWRPLAPVVPEELFTRIFEVENTDMCEYMLRTLPVRKKWQPRLQAVCHVDGTTRAQLLRRETNPELYDLLMAYFEKAHVPCLVNTSLNINGFPIVETPEDLCYLKEEIDFIQDVPPVKVIFVEQGTFYEVLAYKNDDSSSIL